jgi:hypothetical protein
MVASGSGQNPVGALQFSIDSHPAEVLIGPRGFTYGYVLIIGDQAHVSAPDNRNSQLITSMLAELSFWHDLARATGLRYAPIANVSHNRRYRLVGVLDGFPAVIGLGAHRGVTHPMLDITLRCKPSLDLNALKNQMKQDSDLQELLEDPVSETTELSDHWYRFAISYRPTKQTGSEAAQDIQELMDRLKRHLKPLPPGVCETPTGKHDPGQTPQLVLVNGTPQILCQACIDDLPNRGRLALQAEQQPSPGAVKALLIAAGIDLLGVIVIAAFFASLGRDPRLILVGGLGLFAINARVMAHIRGRLSLSSSLMAAVMGAAGALCSLFLATVWSLTHSKGNSIDTPANLGRVVESAWQYVWRQTGLIWFIIIIIGLYTAELVFEYWLWHRGRVRGLLRPQVEVFGNT